MTYRNYQEYLESDVWARKRAAAKRRDHYMCCHCESQEDLHVHHIRYRHPWGSERLSDLITLCADCHEQEHARKKPKPKPKPKVPYLSPKKKRGNELKRALQRLPVVPFTLKELGKLRCSFTPYESRLLEGEYISRDDSPPHTYEITKKGLRFRRKLYGSKHQ